MIDWTAMKGGEGRRRVLYEQLPSLPAAGVPAVVARCTRPSCEVVTCPPQCIGESLPWSHRQGDRELLHASVTPMMGS